MYVSVLCNSACTWGGGGGGWERGVAGETEAVPLRGACQRTCVWFASVRCRSVTCYSLGKGPKFGLDIEEEATEITKAMLAECVTPL